MEGGREEARGGWEGTRGMSEGGGGDGWKDGRRGLMKGTS